MQETDEGRVGVGYVVSARSHPFSYFLLLKAAPCGRVVHVGVEGCIGRMMPNHRGYLWIKITR